MCCPGIGVDESETGFRKKLKVLYALLAQIRDIKWRHGNRHVTGEGQPPGLGSLDDCKKTISREAIVHLDEVNVQICQRIHRAAALVRRMNHPNVIVRFRRWPLQHWPCKQEARPDQVSVSDATTGFHEFRDIAAHIADTGNT